MLVKGAGKCHCCGIWGCLDVLYYDENEKEKLAKIWKDITGDIIALFSARWAWVSPARWFWLERPPLQYQTYVTFYFGGPERCSSLCVQCLSWQEVEHLSYHDVESIATNAADD